jgi:coenzyme F420 biosynthesis associated uncharacterized protein
MARVDWPLAERISSRVAGRYPLAGTYHEARFAADAPELVERASKMVVDETGLEGDGSPVVAVVSRQEWAATNVAAFSTLLAPAEERLGKEEGWGNAVAGRVMGAEVGALLGFLSRRVLGQYELVLPSPEREFGDTVMFVGANVLNMERQHEFRPAEFRFWVALHECTHRLQFLGIPWMRPYFLGLVEDLVAETAPEKGRLARVSAEVRESARAGEPLVGDAGVFGLLASPGQRAVIDRVQALMSLLEGHGHVVMDRVGARELVTQKRMSAVLKARRQDPRTAAFMRLVGLDLKLRQYELGEKFILSVEEESSWETLSLAWRGPEWLPTLDEIGEPKRWLQRVT